METLLTRVMAEEFQTSEESKQDMRVQLRFSVGVASQTVAQH